MPSISPGNGVLAAGLAFSYRGSDGWRTLQPQRGLEQIALSNPPQSDLLYSWDSIGPYQLPHPAMITQTLQRSIRQTKGRN